MARPIYISPCHGEWVKTKSWVHVTVMLHWTGFLDFSFWDTRITHHALRPLTSWPRMPSFLPVFQDCQPEFSTIPLWLLELKAVYLIYHFGCLFISKWFYWTTISLRKRKEPSPFLPCRHLLQWLSHGMSLTYLSGMKSTSLFYFLTYNLSLYWAEFSSDHVFAAIEIELGICIKKKRKTATESFF